MYSTFSYALAPRIQVTLKYIQSLLPPLFPSKMKKCKFLDLNTELRPAIGSLTYFSYISVNFQNNLPRKDLILNDYRQKHSAVMKVDVPRSQYYILAIVVNILLIVGLLIGFPLTASSDRTLANWIFSLVHERDSRLR